MDVDLSTDLAALLPLVAPLISGHSDLAIGTRLGRGARGRARAQAGVHLPLLQPDPARHAAPGSPTPSAASRPSAPTSPERLLPLVEDTGWFFDTEMLVLAERAGLRIHEVPVDWVDDPDSRVDIVATALRRPARHLARRARPRVRAACRSPNCAPPPRAPLAPTVPGCRPRCPASSSGSRRSASSTLAHLLLFLLFREVMGAIAANVVALLITSIANTAANRRLHLRCPRTRGRRPPPAPGSARLRARRLDDGRAGAARAPRARREPGRRAGRDRPRQRRRHRAALRVSAPAVFRPRTALASSAPITQENTA